MQDHYEELRCLTAAFLTAPAFTVGSTRVSPPRLLLGMVEQAIASIISSSCMAGKVRWLAQHRAPCSSRLCAVQEAQASLSRTSMCAAAHADALATPPTASKPVILQTCADMLGQALITPTHAMIWA